MPAQAGIHLRAIWKAKENLDSGLRRNDDRKGRLLVDEFTTPRLQSEGHSVLNISKLRELFHSTTGRLLPPPATLSI